MTETTGLLHEPWPDRPREMVSYQFGMWIFIATEVLFFGALIAFYVVNRWAHPFPVDEAASHSAFVFGTANTAILMTSSLFAAIADRALEKDLQRITRVCLWATLLLGLSFLVVKGFEYKKDIDDHLWPGAMDFEPKGQGARPFWSFYWTATGVHALHVTIGLGVIGRLIWLSQKRRLTPRRASMTITTLYWHFVDVVWVVLYALIYLVGRT